MSINKRVLSVLLLVVLFMQLGFSSFAANDNEGIIVAFSDNKGHYAENIINEWIQKGLISGYPDGTFRPNNNVTRAEYVTLFNRAFKPTPKDQTNIIFHDVAADDWFYSDVMLATSLGIIVGYPNGCFGFDDPITRQDACVIISRFLSLTDDFDQSFYNKFADRGEISDYAIDHIAAAASAAIINGKPDGVFAPNENISRADSVIMLNNACKYLEATLSDNEVPLGEQTSIPSSFDEEAHNVETYDYDDEVVVTDTTNSGIVGGGGGGGGGEGGGSGGDIGGGGHDKGNNGDSPSNDLKAIDGVDYVYREDGRIRIIDGSYTDLIVSTEESAAAAINAIGSLLSDEFNADTSDITCQNINNVVEEHFCRYTPTIDGVSVLGSQIVLTTEEAGEIKGLVSSYDGRIENVNTIPLIDAEQSIAIALNAFADSDIVSEILISIIENSSLDYNEAISALLSAYTTDTELIIYAISGEDTPVLAWSVDVYPFIETSIDDDIYDNLDNDHDDETWSYDNIIEYQFIDVTYYIYANDINAGEIFDIVDNNKYWYPISINSTDWLGITRTLNIESDGNKYRLKDNGRDLQTYAPNRGFFDQVFGNQFPGSIISWNIGSFPSSYAVSAHANMACAFDFYKNQLGRNSYDGKGKAVKTTTEFSYKNQTSNACWSPSDKQFKFYGGNNGDKKYAAALDMVGHEFTHAVVEYTCNLVYKNQSGALDEAYADIMGALIENKSGTNRWLMGEDSAVGAIRSMADPLLFNQPNNFIYYQYTSSDNGGVHINNSIFTHAAFLMMNKPATKDTISGEIWAQVFYNSLFRLTNTSSFMDAGDAVYRSAKSLKFTDEQLVAIIDAFNEVGINISPTGIFLNKNSLTLTTGNYEYLHLLRPYNPSGGLVWESSNNNVATVDSTGRIQAKSAGVTTINAAHDVTKEIAYFEVTINGKVYRCYIPYEQVSNFKELGINVTTENKVTRLYASSCVVTVTNTPVTSVSIDKNSINLTIGKSERLYATVLPNNAINKSVTWDSQNRSIATIDDNGFVKAISPGQTIVYATTVDGNKTAICYIIVEPIKVEFITLNRSSLYLNMPRNKNEISQFTITANIYPTDATNKAILWSSSNPDVATIDNNGVVTAVFPGTAIITVASVDGNAVASCTVIVDAYATGISLNKETITLEVGGTETLLATVIPDYTTDKAVTWSSTAPHIASVDNQGVVTAGSILGTAIITVRTSYGGYTATCTVTVVPVPVASVTLDVTDSSLHVGESLTLTATVNPDNATNKSVTWSSDRTSVATVINGVVTAVAVGTATITVRTTDGGYTATCTVNVMPIAVDSVSLNKTDTSIIQGYTERLISTVSPENATDKSVVWSSDNPDIATIDSNGEVRAISIGSATITATTVDGSKTAECTVNVLPIPVNGVSLNRELAYIFAIGNAINLEAYVFPTNAANQNVQWSIDDLNIATVSSDGKVTAVSEGIARVTAMTVDGGYEATCIVIVTSRKTAIAAAAGSSHNMVVANDGSLWAWGANWDGQLGIGDNEPYLFNAYAPIQVGTDTDWVSVTVGNDHTLAIKADGTLWGWGSNLFGEVGIYDYVTFSHFSNSATPIQIGSDRDWASVTTGDSVTFAIKTDGTLWTWGINLAYYNNPVDEPYSFYTPVQLGTDANWDSVTIASGSDLSHVIALKTDGTIWAWGENWGGQLGIGLNENLTYIDTPIQVGSDTDWTSVITGGRITFAIKTDGTLWTWGQNLANKGSDDLDEPYEYYTPVQVGADSNWVSVTTGKFVGYMIALKSDGTIWAWGANWDGQLGMGYDGNDGGGEYHTLVQVGSDSDWVSVVAGKEYTIAIKLDGSLWAWGRAPIGNDTDINSYIPVIIWS